MAQAYCTTCRRHFYVTSNPPYAVIHKGHDRATHNTGTVEHLHAVTRVPLVIVPLPPGPNNRPTGPGTVTGMIGDIIKRMEGLT